MSDTGVVKIGHWSFFTIPRGWQTLEQHGVWQPDAVSFRNSVVALEEDYPDGATLLDCVRRQLETIRTQLPGCEIGDPSARDIRGADEAQGVVVTHQTRDGTQVRQTQIYARSGAWLGILTATVRRGDPEAERMVATIVQGAAFHAEPLADTAAVAPRRPKPIR